MRLLFLEKKKSKRKTAFLCTHVKLSITGHEGGREGGFGLLYFSTRVRAQGVLGEGSLLPTSAGRTGPPGSRVPALSMHLLGCRRAARSPGAHQRCPPAVLASAGHRSFTPFFPAGVENKAKKVPAPTPTNPNSRVGVKKHKNFISD